MKRSLTAALAMTLATAGAASAQEPAPATAPVTTPAPMGVATPADVAGNFGLPGQLVISGELALQLRHQSVGGGSATRITIQPAADYFVAPNISVGGALLLSHASGSANFSSTDVGVGVRGGYNVRLTDILSIWPQLHLIYVHGSLDPMNRTTSTFDLRIFAPVLYHIAPHLFIGVGPDFMTQLMSKVNGNSVSKETDFGLSSVVGGYFGGM